MSRVVRPHLERPADMNWSTMTCAAVDEVAELRLPEYQGLGSGGAIAVLEAQSSELGKWAVVELHGCLRIRQPLDGCPGRPGLHVMQHHVPLAEGAALGILAG